MVQYINTSLKRKEKNTHGNRVSYFRQKEDNQVGYRVTTTYKSKARVNQVIVIPWLAACTGDNPRERALSPIQVDNHRIPLFTTYISVVLAHNEVLVRMV